MKPFLLHNKNTIYNFLLADTLLTRGKLLSKLTMLVCTVPSSSDTISNL